MDNAYGYTWIHESIFNRMPIISAYEHLYLKSYSSIPLTFTDDEDDGSIYE